MNLKIARKCKIVKTLTYGGIEDRVMLTVTDVESNSQIVRVQIPLTDWARIDCGQAIDVDDCLIVWAE